MIRRNTRLRREYLYRKSLEGKERVKYEHKRKIREALEGEPCPAFWLHAGRLLSCSLSWTSNRVRSATRT